MGLTSNGGVHSSFDHLFKLCDISKEYGIENTFIHCFMDGRDTDPKSGKGFIEQLTAHCEEMSVREIRKILKECIDSEDKKKPLSDSAIGEELARQGIVIARRTVAKYREALMIPPVNQRKSL
jgi:hypothetical protein